MLHPDVGGQAPPALYLSQGAPPLVDDTLWVSQLARWAGDLPTPHAILVISAHATIPVLQVSMPTLDPQRLLYLGERLRPLRDEGVLIIGSGFTTHGLPFLDDPSPGAVPPAWSRPRPRHAVRASDHRALRAAVRRAGGIQ
jgi:aromatic ring-opening dioxygenase catalytic subunit (LigB family)